MLRDLVVEEYILDRTSEVLQSNAQTQDLKMAAKRYSHKGAGGAVDPGLTLVFCHGLGAHKEQWEPTLARLLYTESTEGRGRHAIREVWSFDWQSHGDSGVLNRVKLASQHEAVCAQLTEFIDSPRMMDHKLVLIGHCVGMTALTLAISDGQMRPAIKALIMVDPIIITEEVWATDLERREAVMHHFFNETATRPDTWTSREEAHNYLIGRYPWRQWHKDVLRIFVNSGLQSTPSGGCELKCSKAQEALQFLDRRAHFESTAHLAKLSQKIPIHIVWGENHDNIFFSKTMQDASLEPFRERVTQMAVKDCGHMVIQEQPQKLASIIATVLCKIHEELSFIKFMT
ncbi:Alpha/beta hydrolase family-domain-containing protein [Pholiota molesta]|nr:Alpha/beta hydrolase family-domain-containing protein [Pholiota molesta]